MHIGDDFAYETLREQDKINAELKCCGRLAFGPKELTAVYDLGLGYWDLGLMT